MTRVVPPVLAVLLCAAPVSVGAAGLDEPGADDEARITQCLSGADGSEEKCISLVSEPCMALPGGETTVGITACFRRESKVWDGMLNRDYQALKRAMSREEFVALRDTQRAWIKYRDLKCAYPYTVIKGTIAGNFAASCFNTETARRAIDLKRWRDWMNQ